MVRRDKRGRFVAVCGRDKGNCYDPYLWWQTQFICARPYLTRCS